MIDNVQTTTTTTTTLIGLVHIQQGEPKYNQFLKDGSQWEAAICSAVDASDACDVTLPDSFTHRVSWARASEGGRFHAAGPEANVKALRDALAASNDVIKQTMSDIAEVAVPKDACGVASDNSVQTHCWGVTVSLTEQHLSRQFLSG